MDAIKSENLETGVHYWLDNLMDESGIFISQTEEAVFFKPNPDCRYRIEKSGFVKFTKPGEGVWYLKENKQ